MEDAAVLSQAQVPWVQSPSQGYHNKRPSPEEPLSVNWTITTICNYECRFCFARFPEIKISLSAEEMRQVPPMLRDAGCDKLTFVGGEPTLNRNLPDLLRISKEAGLTTMIVTNGTMLNEHFMNENHEFIDWLSLSLDSQFEQIEKELGRGTGGHVQQTVDNAKLAREFGVRLKMNSVITKLNYMEDMSEFILELKPERWKVFQVLEIDGQNDLSVGPLLLKDDEFEIFKCKHRSLIKKGLDVVFEDNDLMRGSYVMLDSLGRFFNNHEGGHDYGPSIFNVGVSKALEYVRWDVNKFVRRGGLYGWRAGPKCDTRCGSVNG